MLCCGHFCRIKNGQILPLRLFVAEGLPPVPVLQIGADAQRGGDEHDDSHHGNGEHRGHRTVWPVRHRRVVPAHGGHPEGTGGRGAQMHSVADDEFRRHPDDPAQGQVNFPAMAVFIRRFREISET